MDTNILAKSGFLLILVIISQWGYSQYPTMVKVNGLNNEKIIEKIESNTSKLLTEINLAFFEKRVPVLKDIEMTEDARRAVLSMWETSPFRCKKTQIKDNIINLMRGSIELRNIPLFMKNADSTDQDQEGVLVYTKEGEIDNLYLTIENKQWKYVLTGRNNVADLRKREIIKDFVENFRTAYNRRDIDFLNKVFSEDALIITGKVIQVYKIDENNFMKNIPYEKIVYNRQKKSEYLSAIRRKFDAYSYINIKFNEVEVVQHPKFPDYYGVTVTQYWNTSGYHDVGYVFLLIDLRDENKPIIHVRTWQPSELNGKELSREEVFNIGVFSID